MDFSLSEEQKVLQKLARFSRVRVQGCMRDYPVEKYLRDVIPPLHGAGSNHIYRIKMCSRMTGLPAERVMPSEYAVSR